MSLIYEKGRMNLRYHKISKCFSQRLKRRGLGRTFGGCRSQEAGISPKFGGAKKYPIYVGIVGSNHDMFLLWKHHIIGSKVKWKKQ